MVPGPARAGPVLDQRAAASDLEGSDVTGFHPGPVRTARRRRRKRRDVSCGLFALTADGARSSRCDAPGRPRALVADMVRVFGKEYPHTRAARPNLAHWMHGSA